MLCLKYNIWYQLLFWFIVIILLLLFCNCMLVLFKEVVIIFLMYIHIYEVKIIPCFQYINTVYFNFLFPFKIIIILSWKFQLFCFLIYSGPDIVRQKYQPSRILISPFCTTWRIFHFKFITWNFSNLSNSSRFCCIFY